MTAGIVRGRCIQQCSRDAFAVLVGPRDHVYSVLCAAVNACRAKCATLCSAVLSCADSGVVDMCCVLCAVLQ